MELVGLDKVKIKLLGSEAWDIEYEPEPTAFLGFKEIQILGAAAELTIVREAYDFIGGRIVEVQNVIGSDKIIKLVNPRMERRLVHKLRAKHFNDKFYASLRNQGFFKPLFDQKANDKALECLRDQLSETEFRRYLKRRYIIVLSGVAGWHYLVGTGHVRVFRGWTKVCELCITPDRSIPPVDRVIALKFLLEHVEEEVWEGANVYPSDKTDSMLDPWGNLRKRGRTLDLTGDERSVDIDLTDEDIPAGNAVTLV